MKSPSRRRNTRRLLISLACVCGLFIAGPVPSAVAAASEGQCDVPTLADQLCEAGKTALRQAGDVATAPVRFAAGGAVDVLTQWVAEAATWLLRKVVNFIDESTSPDLGAEWFTARYRLMAGLSALVLVPILLIASIRAVMNQDVSQLLKSFFVYLPLSVLGTFIAVFLTRALLGITDSMSAAVADGIAGDLSQIFIAVEEGLGPTGTPAAPSFAIFLGALLLIVGAFFVWLELLIRSAAVTVSVFFLPLMLVALVWPATSRWTRRLVETLVALILSKFVIVGVISLAAAALAEPGEGGFGSVMGGAALMLTAAFSPMAMLKLMPIAETAAVSHLEGMGRKPLETVRPGGSVHHAVGMMRSKVRSGATSSQMAMAGTGATTTSAPRAAASTAGAGAAMGKFGATSTDRPAGKDNPAPGDVPSRRSGDARGRNLAGGAATTPVAKGRKSDG